MTDERIRRIRSLVDTEFVERDLDSLERELMELREELGLSRAAARGANKACEALRAERDAAREVVGAARGVSLPEPIADRPGLPSWERPDFARLRAALSHHDEVTP